VTPPAEREIHTGIGRKALITVGILAALIALSVLSERLIHRRAGMPEVQRISAEMKSVTVYFGNRSADDFLTEGREIPAAGGFEAQVKAAIGELIKGPQGGDRVGVIPQGTEIRQAFWVEDSQTLYLDFNNALVANHPGGSAGEYFTIGAILKTVSANFPQVKRVQLLIDGNTVESIAGHYAVDKPIEVQKWR
jgi:spore germination protein GerM